MAIKENAADICQREMLEREQALAKKSRVCDVVLASVFCIFIAAFAIFHVATPDKSISESENKSLKKFPKFNVEEFLEGEFGKEINVYLSDQFPARDFFVKVKAGVEKISLRGENGGVFFNSNVLIEKLPLLDENRNYLKNNLNFSERFAASMKDNDIPCILAVAPRKVDVYTYDVPLSYGDSAQNEVWSSINDFGKNFSGNYIELREGLQDKYISGEDVYYNTDHHWTTLGAYYAYKEIYDTLPNDIKPVPEARELSFFDKETVTKEFYGTSYYKSGAYWVSPDSIDLYHFDGDKDIPIVSGDDTHKGIYFYDRLDTKDKYSVFFGQQVGRLDIGNGDKPKLVIIKDSFALSVAPFLAADFDIVMIDPRYYTTNICDIITNEIDPDAVIILMNVETLCDNDYLYILRP